MNKNLKIFVGFKINKRKKENAVVFFNTVEILSENQSRILQFLLGNGIGSGIIWSIS